MLREAGLVQAAGEVGDEPCGVKQRRQTGQQQRKENEEEEEREARARCLAGRRTWTVEPGRGGAAGLVDLTNPAAGHRFLMAAR